MKKKEKQEFLIEVNLWMLVEVDKDKDNEYEILQQARKQIQGFQHIKPKRILRLVPA